MVRTKKPPRESLKPDESLCDYCSAKCCKYFAMPIDEPTRSKDFDFIRWYLLHDRATVFVEDDSWYLLVHTVCEHLQADNRCGIYETRPQICRDYSTVGCEYEDDWTYERYFETADQVAEYAEAVLKKKAGQGLRSPRPTLLPLV